MSKLEPEEEENGFMMLGGDLGVEEEPKLKAQDIFQRPKKSSLIKVPKEILSQVGAAIRDFDMIRDGDRVLVALSGGKDSLALVHILRHF